MPNDPENSQPAAPQSAPEHAGPQGQPQPGPQQPGPQPQPYPYAAPTYSPAPAPYAADARGALPPFNVMALIAFIGAFVVPVVGIVCGHIVLGEYRRGLPERGREYAKAGLILGYIFTALWVALAIVWIVFAFTHFGHVGDAGFRSGSGTIPRFGGGNGGGGNGGGGGFRFPTPGATPGS